MSPFKKLSIACACMMFVGLIAGLVAGQSGDADTVTFAQGFLAGIGLLWWICAIVFDALHFDSEPKRSLCIGSGLFGGPPP